MLYEVRLTATHTYARAAVGGRHLLRLMPAEIPGLQRMIAGSLEITPRPRERYDRADFFGNRTTGLLFAEAHNEVAFTVRARVERSSLSDLLDISPALADLSGEVMASRSLAPDSPHHFLGVSPRVWRDAAIGDYARAVTSDSRSTLGAVAALNRALHDDMTYDPDATTVGTTPTEAFAARHGVCQDFTHIMIAGLRDLGVPARYVSGFLRTEPPKGKPRLEGADAMHAWVSAWCGTRTGWVEFDPTNAVEASSDHIVVARGRDYSDVAPVKGVLWTAGTQTADQAVDVIPLG
ncbi:MAG: transglutaminase family protein [Rhizobiales bacterium]|nr:transglutaminase family protein [Hyphomicrobiales bacterium]